MKKLLSLLAVSTLVGTSASSLKPLFINNFVNTGFKSNQINNNLTMINSPFISEFKDLKDKKIEKVIIAPNGTIYAGSSANGLYKSTDGVSFNPVNGIPDNYAIQSIGIALSGEIWVGTNQNLYFSNDNGVSFNPVTNDKINNITSIAIAPNGTVYVAVYGNGLWKFTKGDTDFQKITSVLSSIIDSIYIDENGIIYFGSSFVNSGLYKSDDGLNFINIYSNHNITYIYVASNGTIYANVNQKFKKSTDGGNSFLSVNGISNEQIITSITIAPNGTIYAGSEKEGKDGLGCLYISVDQMNFTQVPDIKEQIKCLFLSNGIIYFTTGDYYSSGGLFKGDLIGKVMKYNKPDYWGVFYNGFVYKNEQTIELQSDYLKSATLDGTPIDISSKQKITLGIKHNLVLILNNKDNCNQYLDLFGGDPTTGQITYNFWIKNKITQDEFNYSTIIHDTDLLTGLVSDLGNTIGKPIIQTKQKDGSGVITLNTKITSEMINLETSYYEQGTVNDTTNDFTTISSKQKMKKDLIISTDGIYHLHLVDVVGNTYDSYLELGESNWKLQGKFDDVALNDKANKLNVTVDSHSASQEVKQEANGWLDNYKNIADSTFNDTVSTKGKGFVISIDNDLKGEYKSFLDPVTYVNTQTSYAINQQKLDQVISDIAEQKLQDGLSVLPQNLNVDTKNVVNKSTFDSYTSWINAYNDFINNHKDQWINDVVSVASRGFATTDQENQIKNHIASLDFKNYLQHVLWTANSNLSTSNDYQQFVELDKLQSDTIDWVNKNIPEINQAYQNAIKDAESNLNLHGYSISEILNDKKLPKTKSEIDNFADGQSFHDWLQAKADNMYHVWQLKVGLPIGLILLGLTVFASLACYWKFSARHNPIKRAKKTFKPIPDKNIKKKSK